MPVSMSVKKWSSCLPKIFSATDKILDMFARTKNNQEFVTLVKKNKFILLFISFFSYTQPISWTKDHRSLQP